MCNMCECLKQTEKECELCEKKHENNKVFNNILRRFKNVQYGLFVTLKH